MIDEIRVQNGSETLLEKTISEKSVPGGPGNSFGEILKNSINEVNKFRQEADSAVEALASGDGKDIHQTMIAIEKAEVSFKLMMQVRNKIISAYEEVMRMQI
ncbi:MAG: flagellar hook-basal body complex protein FliE [Desulfatiglans sp.]|jgi:flagellar hook-basal body complex protein FliE|nr:flagellar hook-basal body complex protein FliE [Thermodesulfobacteriota bacterium]MEE4354472.1 flagellar hook-basal body complex protein FliE [Desulfatiglans sp.]